MTETKGKCPHGEFELTEGCPQCIAERRQASIRTEPETLTPEEELEQAPFLKQIEEDIGAVEPAETALTLRTGEDIEAHGYFIEAQKLLDKAEARVIATIQDIKAATNDLSLISVIKKAMDGKRKEYLEPLKAQTEAIRDTYDYLMAPILEAGKITRNKMLAYDAEVKRIRQEQEEINRKRMEAAEAEMRLKGELSESVNLVEVAPEAPKRVSTEMGTSGVAKVWKFEVIDFALLPDRFKMENATLIGKVVRAGEREIPGVKIWSEDTLRVKAR